MWLSLYRSIHTKKSVKIAKNATIIFVTVLTFQYSLVSVLTLNVKTVTNVKTLTNENTISAECKKCYVKCETMSLNVKKCYKCEKFFFLICLGLNCILFVTLFTFKVLTISLMNNVKI